MPSLTDLPGEIILEISGYVRQAHDIDSWLRTSKRIRALNRTKLQTHQQLRRRYRFIARRVWTTVHDSPPFAQSYRKGPAELLREILDERGGENELPSYIEWFIHVHPTLFETLTLTLGSALVQNQFLYSWDSHTEASLRKLMEESRYIRSSEINAWLEEFRAGNDGPSFGLLLTLLPNLRRLDLANSEYMGGLWLRSLYRIAKDPDTTILTSLVIVRLRQSGYETTLRHVLIFLALPSVRNLTVNAIFARSIFGGNRTLDHFKGRKFNVTHLAIDASSIDFRLLASLLALCPRLEAVKYVEALTDFHGSIIPFRPFSLHDSLWHSRFSLERLTVEVPQPHKINKNILGSLRNFERLKQLSINLSMMIADPSLDGLRMEIDPDLLLDDLEVEMLSAYHEGVYSKDTSLATTLPNSIEEIILHDSADRRSYHMDLLVKLMVQKRLPLPNLTKIILRSKEWERSMTTLSRLRIFSETHEVQIIVDEAMN